MTSNSELSKLPPAKRLRFLATHEPIEFVFALLGVIVSIYIIFRGVVVLLHAIAA